jgi:hypothetical protein
VHRPTTVNDSDDDKADKPTGPVRSRSDSLGGNLSGGKGGAVDRKHPLDTDSGSSGNQRVNKLENDMAALQGMLKSLIQQQQHYYQAVATGAASGAGAGAGLRPGVSLAGIHAGLSGTACVTGVSFPPMPSAGGISAAGLMNAGSNAGSGGNNNYALADPADYQYPSTAASSVSPVPSAPVSAGLKISPEALVSDWYLRVESTGDPLKYLRDYENRTQFVACPWAGRDAVMQKAWHHCHRMSIEQMVKAGVAQSSPAFIIALRQVYSIHMQNNPRFAMSARDVGDFDTELESSLIYAFQRERKVHGYNSTVASITSGTIIMGAATTAGVPVTELVQKPATAASALAKN